MLEYPRFSQQPLVQVVDPVSFESILDVLGHELVFNQLFDEGGLYFDRWYSFLTRVFVAIKMAVSTCVGYGIRYDALTRPYLIDD